MKKASSLLFYEHFYDTSDTFLKSLDFGDFISKICLFDVKIGERGNSVYGMRAPGYGGKGEDGKAKTQ